MSIGKRLLIIDDEADFARFVEKVATELGYDAVMTTRAKEFQAQYLAATPDVIVLDIIMPDQDGIETIKWLVGRGCAARILIISGYNPTFAAAAQMIGQARGNLEISLLQKPIKLVDLRAHLHAAAQ